MVAEKIESVLAHLPNLPVRVAKWDVKKGYDWSGDQAVWVWATLAQWPDLDVRIALRAIIDAAVQEAEGTEMIYVRFRDAAEEAEVAARAAAGETEDEDDDDAAAE
jgi:hypothetical protein